MIRHHQRRGFTLIELLGVLLLVTLLISMATSLAVQCLHVQGRSTAWSQDSTAARHLLGELSADVRQAKAVHIDHGVLVLRSDARTVRYEQAGETIRRTETVGDRRDTRSWPIERMKLAWVREQVRPGQWIVWTRVTLIDVPNRGGPAVERTFAAAERLGVDVSGDHES
jgi:prepilin-type N-terminal cleavage/methylation domain-containing protein